MSERTISAGWVQQITEALGAAGLDVPALCKRAGLDLKALADPDARFETEKLSVLWELAVARSGNPAIAMVAPKVIRPVHFDTLGYVMMSSPHLRGALERAIRYVRIVSGTTSGRLTSLDEGWRLDVALYVGSRPAPRQRYEFMVLSTVALCRWIAGGELRPLRVEFRHPVPDDVRPYEEAFLCPVRFGSPGDAILFSHADMLAPLPASNPRLAELHDRFAEQRIEQLDQARSSDRVRRLIVQALPDGEPTRAQIAKAMGMGVRTFQRRLFDEGTSFHELLDGTRRDLAERYLTSDAVSLTDATYLLGFSDQSNFTRASKRWFELSPRKLRSRLTLGRADTVPADTPSAPMRKR